VHPVATTTLSGHHQSEDHVTCHDTARCAYSLRLMVEEGTLFEVRHQASRQFTLLKNPATGPRAAMVANSSEYARSVNNILGSPHPGLATSSYPEEYGLRQERSTTDRQEKRSLRCHHRTPLV
jgi:hypothetical protein